MVLTFLGKDSKPNESPTLYATDQDMYIIQGYIVTNQEITTKLDISATETIVEVPPGLFAHLVKDGVQGTITTWAPPIVHLTEDGNYIVQGERVTSPEMRGQMGIPEHEDCVLVPKSAIRALFTEG
jgi:hypothetical protein